MSDDQPRATSQYDDCPPAFITATEHLDVLHQLMQREPVFHHPEFGTTRQDLEAQVDEAFWEVGASGRRYHRDYVVAEMVKRYENPQYQGIHSPPESTWEIRDVYCRAIATDTYLLTYTLIQDTRITRRSTLWQRSSTGWKALYHQGTTVQD